MRKTNIRQYALAFSMGLTLCGAAYGEDWKATGYFGWLGVGKAYEIEKGHLYWLGEFSGAFANDKGKGSLFDQSGWKCPGFNDVDTNDKKNKAAGRCIISDTDGDQAYSTWQCEGDTMMCSGTFDYRGGRENTRESMGTTRFLATFR